MSFSALPRKRSPEVLSVREPESQQGMRTGGADDVLEVVLVHDLCEGKF
jgi:hypothetical protein